MSRPLSDFVHINPKFELPAGANARTPVSFVPMSDVTESGHWIGRQVRSLQEVSSGFTTFSDADVLVAKITPCFENGKGAHVTGLINGIGFGSTEFHVLRARPHVHPRFIHHIVQSARFRIAAERFMTGSAGQKRVAREAFDAFSLPDFSDQEQRAISQTLDILDTALRQTEAVIEKLKQVKQGLLHDLLTRGIDANGELRPPQNNAPHLYKDSPLGWIPSEWEVKRLQDFMAADITYGIVQAGPHVVSGVPYIRTGDMAGDRLVSASLLRTSRRIADSYRRSEVRASEIVMAIRATVGKVLPVPQDLDGANLTQGTARLAPNLLTDTGFLLWAIRHQRAQESIQVEIKGTTFAEITLAALREVPLAAPIAIDEQRLIGARVAACEERIQLEHRQREKLGTLKSGLMDDLLTGRVRVSPLLDTTTRT
jgi:type I restriction enzyme, S subunit